MTVEQVLLSESTDIEKGITIVEASAGTGKTFAISTHVLRAIVELSIKIDQILVVTFTVAATEDLKDRIRARLIEGRKIMTGSSADFDDVLVQWAARIEDKRKAVRLLDLALLDIDCIPIYTIHGFCQRMLTEQPVESGQLFDVELVGDAQLLQKSVVNDYWRATLYDFDKRFCHLVTTYHPDPESLFASVAGAEDLLAEIVPEAGSVKRGCALIELHFTNFKNWWQNYSSELIANLDTASRGGFLNKDLNNNYRQWCQEIERSMVESHPPVPDIVAWLGYDNLIGQLNGRKLRGQEKKREYLSHWVLPGEMIDLYSDAVDALILEIRLELAALMRTAFPQRLEQHGKMTFDDLVVRLASAVSGQKGALLRQKIRQRYSMVLIDEFQDTDSAQWQIFNVLFCTSFHILYLIGDPKQAIYRFRGADIVSYFQAREKAQRIVTLRQNFRSHPQLMEAVNDLFAETVIAGLPYKPVVPARKELDGSLADGSGRGVLVYCQLDMRSGKEPRWSGGLAHDRIRRWVVGEIVRLLTPENGVMIEKYEPICGFCKNPLLPADIAILVRTNSQAQEYHDALSQVSIPSVVASKTSVFKTGECAQLLHVIRAVAVPASIPGLKAAMSCDWFGLTGDYFVLLNGDDTLLTQWVERYHLYHQLWQEHGFLVMMTRLLEDEKVFIYLSELAQAERRIANIQHLCELVQEMTQLHGLTMEQTIIWLQKMIVSDLGVDEMELRLESDGDAVAIVTMHGAKGLEFPITFCPHLMSGSPSVLRGRSVVRCHDRDNRLIVDLGSENFEENSKRAYEEEVEEDLRLAYVAITRAQLRCYLFWADIKGWGGNSGSFQSPLGTMLFPHGNSDFEYQYDHLHLLGRQNNSSHLLIEEESAELASYRPPDGGDLVLQPEKRGRRSFTTNRTVTSFSGLVSFTAHTEEALAGAFDERGTENRLLESSRLPAGVRFGNLVHDILENIDFQDLAENCYDGNRVSRLCQRYGLEVDHKGLQQLLKDSVTTSLLKPEVQGESFSLADIAPEHQVKELGFSLYMTHTTTDDVNRILVSQQTYVPLLYREMEGFLNGYIDLICFHDGRYYVIDYKTNYLGDHIADYSRAALVSAMRAHNYGLQYWLYSLVVHRYLKRWLPGYSYTDHFGGVMYLFVRGMMPETAGSGVYSDLPDEQVLNELDRCFGEKP